MAVYFSHLGLPQLLSNNSRRTHTWPHSENSTCELETRAEKFYTVDDNMRSLTLSYLPSRSTSWSRANLVMPLSCLKHPINYIIVKK